MDSDDQSLHLGPWAPAAGCPWANHCPSLSLSFLPLSLEWDKDSTQLLAELHQVLGCLVHGRCSSNGHQLSQQTKVTGESLAPW